MAAGLGTSRGVGTYDPRKNERGQYMQQVQKDLNKRFGKKGMKKKTSPAKEK